MRSKRVKCWCWMSDIDFKFQLTIYHGVFAQTVFLLLFFVMCAAVAAFFCCFRFELGYRYCLLHLFAWTEASAFKASSTAATITLRFAQKTKMPWCGYASFLFGVVFFLLLRARLIRVQCIYIDHVFDVILGTIDQHIILLLYVACCVLRNWLWCTMQWRKSPVDTTAIQFNRGCIPKHFDAMLYASKWNESFSECVCVCAASKSQMHLLACMCSIFKFIIIWCMIVCIHFPNVENYACKHTCLPF